MERIDFRSLPQPWQPYRENLPPFQIPQEMPDEDETALFAYLNHSLISLMELRSELRVSPEGEIQYRPRDNPHYRPDHNRTITMQEYLSVRTSDFQLFQHDFAALGLTPPPPNWGDRIKKSVPRTVDDQVEATRLDFLSIPSSHDLPIAKDSGPSQSSEPVAVPDEYSMPDDVEAYFTDRFQALIHWFNQQLANGNAMEVIRRRHQEREKRRHPKPKHQPESESGQDW
jgi:hypothetical protein